MCDPGVCTVWCGSNENLVYYYQLHSILLVTHFSKDFVVCGELFLCRWSPFVDCIAQFNGSVTGSDYSSLLEFILIVDSTHRAQYNRCNGLWRQYGP